MIFHLFQKFRAIMVDHQNTLSPKNWVTTLNGDDHSTVMSRTRPALQWEENWETSPLFRSGWRLQLWTWWGHWGNQYRHHTPHRELKTQIIDDRNSSHIYKSDFKTLPGWPPYWIIELQLNSYRKWFIIQTWNRKVYNNVCTVVSSLFPLEHQQT